MKYIVLIILLTIISCKQYNDCPEKILNAELCINHNQAKWELYKLYIECLENNPSIQKEFLSQEIIFTSIDSFDNITMIYLDSELMREVVAKKLCFYYYGIGFEKDEIKVFIRGDNAVLDFDKLGLERLDSILRKTIIENQENLHPWLLEQAMNREYIN